MKNKNGLNTEKKNTMELTIMHIVVCTIENGKISSGKTMSSV